MRNKFLILVTSCLYPLITSYPVKNALGLPSSRIRFASNSCLKNSAKSSLPSAMYSSFADSLIHNHRGAIRPFIADANIPRNPSIGITSESTGGIPLSHWHCVVDVSTVDLHIPYLPGHSQTRWAGK